MPRVITSVARPATPWSARRAGEEYGQSATPNWRAVDWAAHLRRIRIDGRELNYVDVGESAPGRDPVVFVHGLGGQWQNWLENIPRAAQERRVIALDLPGSGLSEMPREQITIQRFGRWVEELCERLELGKVEIVGNSMGGFISSEVAIQFPQRVDRLVLVSAAGISTVGVFSAPLLTLGRAATVLTTYTASRHRRLASRPLTRHFSLALVARHPSRLAPDLCYEGFFKGTGKPGFNDSFRACFEYDFRDRLPEVACPTLIVWGENDAILPVRDAHEFERLIDDSRKLVMRDTGHVPMAERPQTFNDVLMEFLAETGPAEDKEPVPGQSQAA